MFHNIYRQLSRECIYFILAMVTDVAVHAVLFLVLSLDLDPPCPCLFLGGMIICRSSQQMAAQMAAVAELLV